MLSRQNRVRISEGRDDLKINRQRNPLSPGRLAVRTSPFHGGNPGSSPGPVSGKFDNFSYLPSFLWLGAQFKKHPFITRGGGVVPFLVHTQATRVQIPSPQSRLVPPIKINLVHPPFKV